MRGWLKHTRPADTPSRRGGGEQGARAGASGVGLGGGKGEDGLADDDAMSHRVHAEVLHRRRVGQRQQHFARHTLSVNKGKRGSEDRCKEEGWQ